MKPGDLILAKYLKSSTFRGEELGLIIQKDFEYITVLYTNGNIDEFSVRYYYNYYSVII